MNQQARLTPQLQLAIRLLQMSTLDLKQEIQAQVESNPMLEESLSDEIGDVPVQAIEEVDEETFDFQWSHLYTNSKKSDYFNEEAHQDEPLYAPTVNLKDYLRWQLELAPMTEVDQVIALTLIDATDNNGFLTLSLIELHEVLSAGMGALTIDEIEVVRHRIQHFDPMGCCGLNLAEVLIFQLNQLPCETPNLALAKKIISENIQWLGKHNYRQIMKKYHITEKNLDDVILLIQELNPNPGVIVSQNTSEFIMPDLMVKKTSQGWQVVLNPSILPHLGINHYYASLIPRTKNHRDHQFLKNNLNEARWFLKSIEMRQDTLLRVACYIVDYQNGFLEYGEEAMKPLILNDVAKDLGLHESTISRVTTQKFIDTPRGLFELKYFFSSHVSTTMGGECSSTAIRAVIKKLIVAENRQKPLSDSAITTLMREQGINIARRTVAKYRVMMNISPSSERKSIDF
jgi:RNA polymerase sigma-54 factor